MTLMFHKSYQIQNFEFWIGFKVIYLFENQKNDQD